MNIVYISNKVITGFLTAFGMVAIASTAAFAHVVVTPSEAPAAGYQTFTMSVPNEKSISNTSLKLVMPAGLKNVTPTQKAGWNIVLDKQGTAEDAVVKSITWNGNAVKSDFRDEFTFSAKLPDQPTEIQWKAYQTYSDGSVVSWDQSGGEKSEKEDSGPFSVTKVVNEDATPQTESNSGVDNGSSTEAKTALYTSAVAIIIGLASLYFAIRK